VLNVLGILQYQRGKVDAAIALMERLLALRPQADGVWNNLGNAVLQRGEIDAAEAAVRRSLELVPSAERGATWRASSACARRTQCRCAAG